MDGKAPDAHLELHNSRECDFLADWRPTVGRLAGALKVEPENLVCPLGWMILDDASSPGSSVPFRNLGCLRSSRSHPPRSQRLW
jgi:hypothetical protein